ncbi:MAG: cytidine deaminase [Bacteroidaceae bacterium]|nr:cytidine deaminase [Bacteroidaceae bacterium]
MKQLTITIPLVKKDEAELTPDEANLLEKAKQATYRSYSPYSHFSVGAAALLDDGTIIEGANQENCAYPSGLCAERTAVFYANAQYPDRAITLLCVAARDTEGNFTPRPIPPCGGCRQVLSETEDRQHQPMRVMLYGTEGIYFVNTVKDLLPIHFDTTYL